MPSSGHFRCKQCNFFPEQGKFLNFFSKIKHLTKLSKDLRFLQVPLNKLFEFLYYKLKPDSISGNES